MVKVTRHWSFAWFVSSTVFFYKKIINWLKFQKEFPQKMSLLTTEERKKCWANRDPFWKCQHSSTSGENVPDQCQQFGKLVESSCFQWVKHFDRKRTYDQFKARMEGGYDPMTRKSWSVVIYYEPDLNKLFTIYVKLVLFKELIVNKSIPRFSFLRTL